MPTPTRDRRQFVRPPAPVVADEEDDQPEVPASPVNDVEVDNTRPLSRVQSGPLRPYQPPQEEAPELPTGTTGGLIPQHANDRPQSRRLSDDPAVRGQQALATAQEQFKEQQLKQNPFLFSPAIKKVEEHLGRQGVAHIQRQADQDYGDQLRVDRAAAINDRRAQQNAIKQENATREAQFRGTGQEYYTDPFGRVQPVLETGTNRPLYKRKGWTPSTDPKTNLPALMMVDKYGQRQFKQPALQDSIDPHDDNLYAKDEAGQDVPYMTKAEAAKSKDIKIAKMGMAALKRKNTAGRMESIQLAQDEATGLQRQVVDATASLEGYDAEIADLSAKANDTGIDPIQRDALLSILAQTQVERDALAAQVGPRGELKRRQWMANARVGLMRAQARKDTALEQREQITARLRENGMSDDQIAQDPIYQANERMIAEASSEEAVQDVGIKRAGALAQRQQQMAAPAQPGVAPAPENADVFQQREPFMLASKGVKNIGGLSVERIASMYGDGRGAPDPQSVIKIGTDLAGMDQLLSSPQDANSQVTDTRRAAMEEERNYLDGLFKQRMARLTPEQQQEVIDATRDPTTGEKAMAAGSNLAEGAGTALTDMAEFAARNAKYAPNMMLPGITKLTPEPVRKIQAEQDELVKEFAGAMRETAGEWGPEVPAQVGQKLEEGVFTGVLPKTIGSAAAMMTPAGPIGATGRLLGLGEKALATLGTLSVASSGAAASGNAFRREAEGKLRAQLKAGEITQQEFETGVGMAEIFGAALGTTEAVPLAKMVQRLGGVPAGQTFLQQMFKTAARGGNSAVAKWLQGNGKGVLSEALEEGGQELVQALSEDIYASQTFDPERKIGEGAAGNAATGGTTGAILSIITRMLGGKGGRGATPTETAPTPAPSASAAEAEARRAARQTQPAKFEPVGAPSTAEQAAQVLEPALKEQANTPPPSKSAAESAQVFAEEEQATRAAAVAEEGAQRLVDEVQEASGKTREEVLATRNNPDGTPKPLEEWANELQSEAEYRRSPHTVDPERRAKELEADIARLDEDWKKHVAQAEAEARQYEQMAPAQEVAQASFEAEKARQLELMARRDAIEQEMAKLEQVRQSPQSGTALAGQLAEEGAAAQAASRKLATPELEARRDAIESGLEEQDRLKKSSANAAKMKQDLAAKSGQSKPAPVEFLGVQEGADGKPVFTSYRLTEDIPGHPKGSSVTDKTLAKEGYDITNLPKETAAQPEITDNAPENEATREATLRQENEPSRVGGEPGIRGDGRGTEPAGKEGRPDAKEKSDVAVQPVQEEVKPAKKTKAVGQKVYDINGATKDIPAGETAPRNTVTEAQFKELQKVKKESGEQEYRQRFLETMWDNAQAAKEAAKVGKPPEKRTSDKVIEALKKAKISKPGHLYAHTPFTLAWDLSIDIAIDAIKVGRSIHDAVKLGVTRFRSKFPDATPEDIADLEDVIRKAHTDNTTPPSSTTAKSALPESLKDAGVPAESINYEVRNQAERKAEAKEIVKNKGAAEAERMMAEDTKLSGDTRVAIGGQLINERMAALKDAKPEEMGRITRDIRRITQRMQPELATEAGQQIAMFNALYQDARVAAGMEYVRSVAKERTKKLGGKRAEEAAQEVTEIFNKTKDQAARDKAIEKLKERYTEAPVRKMLNELKRIETVNELNKLGVLTRDDMIEVAGNALHIPGISKEKLKHLAELADKIENAKNHAERTAAELELADTLSAYKGNEFMDIESSILTLNIMSGYTTQLGNLAGNALQSLSQLGTAAITNPSKIPELTKGFLEGAGLGAQQARSILATGRGTKDLQDKTSMANTVLQTVDYARDFPAVGAKAGYILTKRARLAEKVGRLMKAADAVFYYPAREAYARMAATKMLETGGLSGDALKIATDNLLRTTPAAFKSAKEQAASEGYSGVDQARRVADIIEEQRASTPEGKEVVKQSERFAAETTYNNEPVGLAGVVYRHAASLVNEAKLAKVQALKPWLMFLRVPTNVFNATTNYTPIGAARAKFGMAGEKKGDWKSFSKDERNRLYLQSLAGTALMGSMVAKAMSDDDMDVSAAGPKNGAQRKQLQNAGWKPYSIKIGNKWVSYKDSPLLVPLSIVGHVVDSIRYQKSKSDMVLESKVVDAISQAPQVIFQTSMLSGFADLMSTMGGKGDSGGVARTLSSIPANLVIPYNRLFQQIDQTFDDKTYDANPIQQSIPFLRRTDKPITDVEGREQKYSPMDRFASTETNDPLDKALREKNVFIPEVGKDVKLGNRVMTDEERDTYRRMSGQRIRIRLLGMAPRFKAMTQEQVQKEVRRVTDEERDKAKLAVQRMPVKR